MTKPIVVEKKQSNEVVSELGRAVIHELAETVRDLRAVRKLKRDARTALIAFSAGFLFALVLVAVRLLLS